MKRIVSIIGCITLLFLAPATAPASNGFLGENSRQEKIAGQAEIHRDSAALNAETHRVCDDFYRGHAADYFVWAHNANCVNIALGVDAGLLQFAIAHNAKIYKDWLPQWFGVDSTENWDPTNTLGGTTSPFAAAFRAAVAGSKQIFFNLQGFNLTYWLSAYRGATPQAFNVVAFGGQNVGSTTAWELEQLVTNKSRRGAEHFVLGSNDMSYSAFKSYVIAQMTDAVRAERDANPNWRTSVASCNAIATLVNFFGLSLNQIAAL